MLKRDALRSESLRGKLLLAFFVTNIVLGILVANNLLLTNRFMSEIGDTYTESMKLHTFIKTLEKTDKSYQDFLQSKSDRSLANYYDGGASLSEYTQTLNVPIVQNNTAFLERSIARLTQNYMEVTHKTIQGKRARDIAMQSEGLTQSLQLYQHIAQRVEALSQIQLESNYSYYTEMRAKIASFQAVSIGAFALIFVSNAIFFVLLIHKITTPLKVLARSSDSVSDGNYNIPPLKIDAYDEVATLTRAFNNMVQNIQRNMLQIEEKNLREIAYRKKEYEMENHLKAAQLKSLQEQVNPHFLFNCLNTAAQLSMMEGADRACRFIEDIADFYRYNLKLLETDTLLQAELEFIETYVEIMQVRFGDDAFRFSTRVDPSLLDCRVPSLILQPIIENCFNYGIRNQEQGGEIIVTVQRKENLAHICIQDNGDGFTDSFLKSFHSNFKADFAPKAGKQSIGMMNVARRIALYYDREDCFYACNRKGTSGAEVSILIPIWKEGDQDGNASHCRR